MTKDSSAAAVFALDQTLIAGTSGPILARHLDAAGLRQHSLPGITASARRSARAAKGWPVAEVRRAARGAADDLAQRLFPYAAAVVDEHKRAGRQLVLATRQPRCLLRPFAAKIGVDTLIATEWQAADGHLTGRIEGPVVSGRGKLGAVMSWAREAGVDSKASYAYSTGYFDSPLLDWVGHPVAVNPEPRLLGVAALQEWPIRYLDAPEGVIKFGGRELQDWVRWLQRPGLVPNARFDIGGTEQIPHHGPVIVVFNHRSYFDPIALSLALARADRPVRFLGKKEVYDAPVLGTFNRLWGGIRVDRASGSDEPLNRAIEAVRAGELVALAPQGTIPRGPAFFSPGLRGRWGAARLAHATRAPVIPVGLWGTEQVWPRSARLPALRVIGRPAVRVRVGAPIRLAYDDVARDAERIMTAIVDLLPDEARSVREPTAEELARTYPHGYRGNPIAETSRRPGTDT
jgi:putative phosphoserine phosphatase/1-acylglycerol-3-phosphate O-acyltransferase